MTPETAANALVAIGAIALLGAFYTGPWRWVMTDYFRHRMFEVRDDLFYSAVSGRICIDDPGYLATREAIHSIIRFVDALSFARVMTHIFVGRLRNEKDSRNPARRAIDEIRDPAARRIVASALARVEILALGLLLAKSPILVSLVAVSYFGPLALFNRARLWWKSPTAVPAPFRPISDAIHAEAATP